MCPALPPSPPAIIMTATETISYADFVLLFGSINGPSIERVLRASPVAHERGQRNWATGYQLGPKTRGARDASRRCRSQRRKARG